MSVSKYLCIELINITVPAIYWLVTPGQSLVFRRHFSHVKIQDFSESEVVMRIRKDKAYESYGAVMYTL